MAEETRYRRTTRHIWEPLCGCHATKTVSNESVYTATTGGARPTTTMAYILRDSGISTAGYILQDKSITWKTIPSSSYTIPVSIVGGTTDGVFVQFFPSFPVPHNLLGVGERQSFPFWCCIPTSNSVYLAFPSSQYSWQDGFWKAMWSGHISLHLLIFIKKSS